jgi:hypothetical protein
VCDDTHHFPRVERSTMLGLSAQQGGNQGCLAEEVEDPEAEAQSACHHRHGSVESEVVTRPEETEGGGDGYQGVGSEKADEEGNQQGYPWAAPTDSYRTQKEKHLRGCLSSDPVDQPHGEGCAGAVLRKRILRQLTYVAVSVTV